MKHIVINGGSLGSKNYYGVQRYTIEILKQIDGMVDPGIVQVLMPVGGEKEYHFQNIEVVTSEHSRQSKIEKLVWDQVVFPHYARKEKRISVDLLVALPLVGCDISAIYDCRTVLFPQNAKCLTEKLKRLLYIWRVRSSTQKNKMIITDSENAKDDICRLFKCKPEKIKVVYGAWQHFQSVEEDSSILETYGLSDDEYFFSLGSQMRHKNLRWVVEAAQQNPQYRFVITGNNKVNEADAEVTVQKHENLIYTGYLSDEKVKALMRNCKAFIQPSLYEGFGLPPMEAMSVGANCIVSNISSLPEVYGDSVWYINPEKYNDIDLDKIMSREKVDNSIVLSKYSWEKSARQIMKLIDGVESK